MSILSKFKLLNKIHYISRLKGEEELTNRVAITLREYSLEGKLKGIWFHVPNETVVSKDNKLRDVLRIQKKHCMGLINGVPDFVFISRDKSIFIELKTEKGRLSEYQKDFKNWSFYEGIECYLARSVEEVIDILINNKLLSL